MAEIDGNHNMTADIGGRSYELPKILVNLLSEHSWIQVPPVPNLPRRHKEQLMQCLYVFVSVALKQYDLQIPMTHRSCGVFDLPGSF